MPVFSSFGIACALAQAGKLTISGESVEIVMTLRSGLIEMLIIRQRSVVFSHSGASWTSSDQIEQVVRSEISRGCLAATEMIGPHTVQQVTLVGVDEVTSSVADEITKRFDNSSIQRFNPADSIVQGQLPIDLTSLDVLATAGVIVGRQKSSVATIDLVNPRKPSEKSDNRRLKSILAVAAVVLLSVGAWKWRDSTIADLLANTRKIETEVSGLKKDFKSGEAEMEQDVAIQQWSQGNIDWLDEMNRVREVMGGTDRLLIRGFTFRSGQGSRRGTITAECYARDRNDVQQFYRRLRGAGYDIVPKGIGLGTRDSDYSTEFSLVLELAVDEEES